MFIESTTAKYIYIHYVCFLFFLVQKLTYPIFWVKSPDVIPALYTAGDVFFDSFFVGAQDLDGSWQDFLQKQCLGKGNCDDDDDDE